MNKNTRYAGCCLISAAMLLAAGCAHKQPPVKPVVDPLIGTWNINGPSGETGLSMKLTVNPDGTMVQTQTAKGIKWTTYSRYTTSKDVLTETLQRVEAGGQSVNGTGQVQSFEYAIQGNTLALTTKQSKSALVFTRVKP